MIPVQVVKKSLSLQLRCCGYNDYNDFTGSPFYDRTNTYPPVCCGDDVNTCDAKSAVSLPCSA